MSDPNYQSNQPTRKEKAKKYLVVVVVAALFIALFSIAIGARNQADENADMLNTPEWKVSFVPGGPSRFPDQFDDVEDRQHRDKVQKANFLWSTIIVSNLGEADATGTSAKINTVTPVQHAFIASSNYLVDLGLKGQDDTDETALTAEIGELDTGEQVYIFLAMNPSRYSKPYDDETKIAWVNEYQMDLNKISIESDLTEYSMFGHGFIPAPTEEEAS